MSYGVERQKEMKWNSGLDRQVEDIFQDSQTKT